MEHGGLLRQVKLSESQRREKKKRSYGAQIPGTESCVWRRRTKGFGPGSGAEGSVPLFESAHGLLDEDDLVSDGLVPLDFQLHVVVVLSRDNIENK